MYIKSLDAKKLILLQLPNEQFDRNNGNKQEAKMKAE